MKGYRQGDMSPDVKDYQAPAGVYVEKFDQKPNEYISRNNRMQEKEAGKLRKQKYMGRYE